MNLVGFQMLQHTDEGGGSPCTPITLYGLDWSHSAHDGFFISDFGDAVFIGAYFSESASGGTAPYNLSVTAGSLPTGCTLEYQLDRQVWKIVYDGTTAYETQAFTLGGTDSLGCPITTMDFSIQIGKKFINTTPVPIPAADTGSMIVSVSGVTNPLQLGCLRSVEFNVTFTGNQDLTLRVVDPFYSDQVVLVQMGDLSGNDITGAIFSQTGVASISTGSNPYTGTWSPFTYFPEGLDYFVSIGGPIDENGDWEVTVDNNGLGSGTIDSASLIFLPPL